MSDDAAWVTIPLPVSLEQLRNDVRTIELLFRINPLYVFQRWQEVEPNRFRIEWENLSNEQVLALDASRRDLSDDEIVIEYVGGLKRRSVFSMEAAEGGSRLTIADDYSGTSEEERKARLAEVDKSLTAWAEAILEFFRLDRRWSWLPGFRWYMRRIWAPMKPASRRIVWMLLMLSLVDFVLVIGMALVWWIEHRPAP